MKKVFLVLILAVSSLAAMAQSEGLAVNVGYSNPILREGLEFASSRGVGGSKTLYKGIKLGIMYDATIIQGFGVTMALNYSFGSNFTAWTNSAGGFTTQQFRFKSSMHSIEIPVEWQYKIPIAGNTYIIPYTGPTIQVHLAGRDRYYFRMGDGFKEEYLADKSYNPFDSDQMGAFAYRRYNVFWGVGLGFQYERYFIRGGYDFGLINAYKSNIYTDSKGDNHAIRSRLDQWQVKLGIYLWSPND